MWLVEDWKRVTLVGISFWCQVGSFLALIVPEALFEFTGRDSDPVFLWWVGALLALAGIVGRIIAQERAVLVEWVRILAVIFAVFMVSLALSERAYAQSQPKAFLDFAVPLVSKWEGKENHAYYDQIAKPPVWTVCYGETRGVQRGDFYTDQQCIDKLRSALLEYRSGLHEFFNCQTLATRLPAPRDAAYTSLAYNVGVKAAGRSTATRRLNNGDIRRGCIALGWWNRAGGRVIRGLVNRRADEVQLCLIGE